MAHRLKIGLLFGTLVLFFAAGCENAISSNDRTPPASGDSVELRKDAPLVVSSPYLEAAIREIMGRDVSVVRLSGPSMCPGHFDIRPSQISDLARCRLFIRFDFQQALDKKLRSDSCRTEAVCVKGGLCVPDSYLSAARQVADCLVREKLIGRTEADARLNDLAVRMKALGQDVKRQIEEAGLHGTPVLASGHQVDFCRWLGLNVVADISSSDASGIRDLDESLKAGQAAGVKIVVANEPEGRRAADAVAERLQGWVVVFANFPDPDQPDAFDAMVRRNAAALLDQGTSNERTP